MRNIIKQSLLASTFLIGTAMALSAETVVVVPLDVTGSAVVGTTVDGDPIVRKTTYIVVAPGMTAEQIAAVNSDKGLPDGPAPGPYFNWKVTSADGQPVGVVTYSVQDENGIIDNVVVLMEDGRSIRIANGISAMGDGTIELRITKAEVLAASVAGFSNIRVD